jgi:hypothetical protein
LKKTAVEYYRSGRGNCAKSVAYGWNAVHPEKSADPERFSSFGGGKAPEGLCGALYAARDISGNDAVNDMFAAKTGGRILCRDIRMNRVMPCHECVALAAEILESVESEKNGR